MPSPIEVLASLQIVDQSLRAKTIEATEGEARVSSLDAAVEAQAAVATATQKERDALATRQRDLEGRLTAAEAKMKDRRMRITRIRNEKELGMARREVELLKEETAALETELITVMEQSELSTTRLAALQEELGRLTSERDTEAAELRAKLERLASEINRDQAQRTQIVETVDGELRRRYEMIFSRRGGLAVVEVRGGTCQGCRMRVPPQLHNEIQRGEKVILCPNCQRMLYCRSEGEEANG